MKSNGTFDSPLAMPTTARTDVTRRPPRFSARPNLKFQIGKFAWRKSFLRELDHLRRGVNARPPNRAARRGRFRRVTLPSPQPTSRMCSSPRKLESGDEFARPGLLHDGIRGVIRGVPPGSLQRRGQRLMVVSETPYVVSTTQTNPAVSGKPQKCSGFARPGRSRL